MSESAKTITSPCAASNARWRLRPAPKPIPAGADTKFVRGNTPVDTKGGSLRSSQTTRSTSSASCAQRRSNRSTEMALSLLGTHTDTDTERLSTCRSCGSDWTAESCRGRQYTGGRDRHRRSGVVRQTQEVGAVCVPGVSTAVPNQDELVAMDTRDPQPIQLESHDDVLIDTARQRAPVADPPKRIRRHQERPACQETALSIRSTTAPPYEQSVVSELDEFGRLADQRRSRQDRDHPQVEQVVRAVSVVVVPLHDVLRDRQVRQPSEHVTEQGVVVELLQRARTDRTDIEVDS